MIFLRSSFSFLWWKFAWKNDQNFDRDAIEMIMPTNPAKMNA